MTEPLIPAPGYTIGKSVYRKWKWPGRDEYWYEPYFVRRITAKCVFVRGFMEPADMCLKRRVLERTGSTTSYAHSAVFYVEMPEEYRKTTIGYLMAEEPRKVLGLPVDFTPEQLKDAYRRLALETHPDRGGDAAAFIAVQEAYERLSSSPSIGEIIRFAEESKET